ncbi:hypothetical protein TRV_00187 [Trichophyton verrucosum HKI 0517]|uniref:Uncharacterized protein n=1 Tax=Trichophyton verrucosum (strain HKI 0517) TaxID=663202 RepID=D4CZE5_TRIVH|nr:uncharacterized protein TRV_00187 [Trichophyton verrucosum HKI 0517]EFE45025.1 hypothetical protein TRV_00187 [Trichophyton verrucosum HKI 0517]
MASALLPKLYLLLSLLSVVFADAKTGPYLAYIDSDDKPVTVTSIKGSDEYRAFMEDTERNEGVIVTKEEVLNILGEPRNITAISVPQYFNDSSMGMIFSAASDIENSIRYWQVKKQFYLGRFAYGLSSCEGFGLDPKNCNVEDDLPPIIFVDYNEEYLQIMLAEVGEFTFGDLYSVRLPSLGAKRLLDNNLDEYRLELQSAIQDFKDRVSVVYIDSVGEIVMSGEAPKPAFEIIRDAIAAVLPHHVGMIRDSIDPLFTDAVGAAEFAKILVLDPEDSHVDVCNLHDEL